MKYFMWFALCAVATLALIYVICSLLDLGKPGPVVLYVPLAFLYLSFYGFSNPFTKSKSE